MWGIHPPPLAAVYRASVHPHVCGEYCTESQAAAVAAGSPPRVWGILDVDLLRGAVWPVHPHVCGEYCGLMTNARGLPGSPPRVWGILIGDTFRFLPNRFTPTCVGNTRWSGPRKTWKAVHPHVCGEYVLAEPRRHDHDGSPPRVWGIPPIGYHLAPSRRFTPTCVGNTPICCHRPVKRSVHPHVCGEYVVVTAPGGVRPGSPPRVWGILASRRRDPRIYAVHPHVCGEYGPLLLRRPSTGGSPPRVWGILARVKRADQAIRFIPTCVGNTPGASASTAQ